MNLAYRRQARQQVKTSNTNCETDAFICPKGDNLEPVDIQIGSDAV